MRPSKRKNEDVRLALVLRSTARTGRPSTTSIGPRSVAFIGLKQSLAIAGRLVLGGSGDDASAAKPANATAPGAGTTGAARAAAP